MKQFGFVLTVAAVSLVGTAAIASEQPAASKETDEQPGSEPGWEFAAQAVLYYQTAEGHSGGSLFDQGPASEGSGWAKATAGVQIAAANRGLVGGLGAGFQLAGLSTLGSHHLVVSGLVQDAGGTTDGFSGGAVNQAYLTYGAGATRLKLGRQELPRSLSPFAFSEGWNVFKNTFDAVQVRNSSIPSTTLVYAFVTRRNNSVGNLNDFERFYESDGLHMLTAQNTSIDGLALTGSYYFLPDAAATGDAAALWLDAAFKGSAFTIALQGGTIGGSAVPDDNSALGALIAGKLGPMDASLAYSTTGDGSLSVANLVGAGVKTPLYTQVILNQNTLKRDSETFTLTLTTGVSGGSISAVYVHSDLGATALPSVFGSGVGGAGTYQEYELIYRRAFGQNTRMFTALAHQRDGRQADKSQNFFRIWLRHAF